LSEPNPFAPEVEAVALKLTLDAKSFERLAGTERRRAEFLCELCLTSNVDAIWGWEGTPIADGIPVAELRPLRDNARAVGLVGEPPEGFIGGVECWSQFADRAEQLSLDQATSEWFTFYGALAHFSDQSGRHFLVTSDEKILDEKEPWFRRHRIVSVRSALLLVAQVMKAHGAVTYEAPRPNHTVYAHSGSMYDLLARSLLISRRRLFLAARRQGETQEDFHFTAREALCASIFGRAEDLLLGCDRIAAANGQYERKGIVGEILFDLRAIVASATGMIDTVAVLAGDLFELNITSPRQISLNDPRFRKCLRAAGGVRLANEAGRLRPLLAFLWSLRNPILHRGGLPGFILHDHRGRTYRAELTEEQVKRLRSACGPRGETADAWGLDPPFPGMVPSVDPVAFARQLTLATIETVDDLCGAFADDRGVDEVFSTWSPEEKKTIQRFRWLMGLPERGPEPEDVPQ
jgi:hypothetical protein